MSRKPALSIIIPTHNRSAILAKNLAALGILPRIPAWCGRIWRLSTRTAWCWAIPSRCFQRGQAGTSAMRIAGGKTHFEKWDALGTASHTVIFSAVICRCPPRSFSR